MTECVLKRVRKSTISASGELDIEALMVLL